uniref:Uncharacterized protein n=1 Tax=Mycena chlorophos TaxID=658473 RepID=A0ABQ0L328_MYCCL|nr:predicted protein [Mycena chlorophos]
MQDSLILRLPPPIPSFRRPFQRRWSLPTHPIQSHSISYCRRSRVRRRVYPQRRALEIPLRGTKRDQDVWHRYRVALGPSVDQLRAWGMAAEFFVSALRIAVGAAFGWASIETYPRNSQHAERLFRVPHTHLTLPYIFLAPPITDARASAAATIRYDAFFDHLDALPD